MRQQDVLHSGKHAGVLVGDICFSLQMVLTVLLAGTAVMRGQDDTLGEAIQLRPETPQFKEKVQKVKDTMDFHNLINNDNPYASNAAELPEALFFQSYSNQSGILNSAGLCTR